MLASRTGRCVPPGQMKPVIDSSHAIGVMRRMSGCRALWMSTLRNSHRPGLRVVTPGVLTGGLVKSRSCPARIPAGSLVESLSVVSGSVAVPGSAGLGGDSGGGFVVVAEGLGDNRSRGLEYELAKGGGAGGPGGEAEQA
jgi:hypothetical protein